MVVTRIAGAGFWILIASVGVMGQQRDDTSGAPPNAPTEKIVVGTYPSAEIAPWRRLEIRTVDGRREVLTEIIETPDIEGRLMRSAERVTETVLSPSGVAQITRQAFGFSLTGERLLLETTRSAQEVAPDGTTTTVEDTYAQDINGRPRLIWREIHHADRPVAGLSRRESRLFVSDLNGRLQPTEMWSQEVRTNGSDFIDEEAIHNLDVNGDLVVSERTVIHRSRVDGEERTTTETFSRSVGGMIQSDNRLELVHRVRGATKSTSNGDLQTIEEIEERPAVSPNEPVRVVRRTVERLHNAGAAHWESDLQVFDLDVNGRFVLTAAQSGAITGGR